MVPVVSRSTAPVTGGPLARVRSALQFGGPRSLDPRRQWRSTRAARWLQRRFYRYQPGAILALFAVLVGVPLILDFSIAPVRDWLDHLAQGHEVGINLLEHVLVAGMVAAAAYYWVLGLKRQKALSSYRRRARKTPWKLVESSRGKRPVGRRAMSKLLADGIERSVEPAVAVVQGGTGTGRTGFIVGLVRDLARKDLIPIPVVARRDGSFALEALAREAFCRQIDEVLSSDQQADAIWHRARSTRDVVVLVDGLDDEVVDTLWHDNGSQFRQTVRSLRRQRIAVVLATTRALPLGNMTPLHEDLDLFSRDEANRYVRKALKKAKLPDEDALAAVEQLHDPVDDSLIAPFYLDLIVRLQKAGIPLGTLPEHVDQWRAAVIAKYLDGIKRGAVTPSNGSADPDAREPDRRGRDAKKAAEAVARKLAIKSADLTVALDRLKIGDRALVDADDLNLLWRGTERVGFAADDLGAYLVATAQDDPSQLLREVCQIAESKSSLNRHDRHVLIALIFWHLRHEGPERAKTFDQFLSDLNQRTWTRPAVVAAAIRIASTCGITDFNERVAAVAQRCIDSLDAGEKPRDAQPRHADELLRLVRALAGWQTPAAYCLLWKLATNRNIEEWSAAKALAIAKDGPGRTLQKEIEAVLEEAENPDNRAAISDPDNQLGNKVASLAWILPALRDTNDLAEAQFSRVAKLCLAKDMSPLRGEMSLAQGLKLAIVNDRNERTAVQNDAYVHSLLFERAECLRFWHARLVLVQAALAHAWKHRDGADALTKQLDALRSNEPHPLVRRGIDLARQGLQELKRSSNASDLLLGKYMWIHERDAVKWVEQGKPEVTQLAADVVLLSNMTYRLRKHDPLKADNAAAASELPRCIRKNRDRQNITHGCTCAHGLCRDTQPPAVLATRARLSENFCREQARLVAQLGAPPWTNGGIVAHRHSQRLKKFWDHQAKIAQRAQ